MDRLFFNIAMLVGTVCFFILLRHQFHMLQLNSYRNDRYSAWAKENFGRELNVWYIFPVIVPCMIMKESVAVWAFAAAYALTVICAAAFTPRKSEKKKFVVTARIKRLYATAAVYSLVMFGLLNLAIGREIRLFSTTFSDRFAVFAVFWIGVWALCYRTLAVRLFNITNAPVEKALCRYYIRDAKKKLASMPDTTVIGITGSYGKTSTKFILQRFLSEQYNTLMTPESYNTPMGVVRTVREQLSPRHKFFICEMGAKQKGDIKEICDIVCPKHCIVTSVGPCHLESFKTIENVGDTKLELYESCDGICVIGFDSEELARREYDKPIIKTGSGDGCDFAAKNISYNENGMNFTLSTPDGDIEIETPLVGASGAKNIAAAAAMALSLGVGKEQIRFAAAHLKTVPHRLEINNKSDDYIVIDDAFNSNPEGAAEALRVLASFKDANKILVTPGMVEMGGETGRINREFGQRAADSADYVVAVGKNADAILEGLSDRGFGSDKAFKESNLNGALARLASLRNGKTVVLFENDLPDNYEE